MTEGELEILDVLKGDIKDKNIKFRRVGGKMNYAEYLKGSPIKREKLKNNPEMDIYSKEEKEKITYSISLEFIIFNCILFIYCLN